MEALWDALRFILDWKAAAFSVGATATIAGIALLIALRGHKRLGPKK